MILTRNKIFTGVTLFGLITSLLVHFDIHAFYLREVFSIMFLTFVPGFLIALILKIRKVGLWEFMTYTVGLSISFLMFGGLLVNSILPLIGIDRPLSINPISTCLYFLIVVMGLSAYFRSGDINYRFKITYPSFTNLFFGLLPLLFPILSVFGAIRLNNGASNSLTMIMLGGIALNAVLLTIVRKRLSEHIYPLAIFFSAFSLLLMTSLRGWYITGHDIQQEYHVFQLTKENYHWSMSLFQDSYNACLSLNILPTILSSFSGIADMYIFKIIFQLIFSFTVVAIFKIFERYVSRPIAFLASFYFISFPTFLNDMPMLNRQEIALLYFALMLLVLFNNNITSKLRNLIFIMFGLSMVVSHYSTSYIGIAIIVLAYAGSLIFKIPLVKKRLRLGSVRYYLSLIAILLIVVFTFIWNTQITQTSGGLTKLVSQTWKNIRGSFSQDLKSGDVLYSIFSWQKLDKAKLLKEYVDESFKSVELENKGIYFFDKTVYEKYPITLLGDSVLPLTPLGQKLSAIPFDIYSFNYDLRQGFAKMSQILAAIGFIGIIVRRRKYVQHLGLEYNVLIGSCILLLGLMVILPFLSIQYGTSRFFQQALIVLALPTVIGNSILFSFFRDSVRLYITLFVFVCFFLSLSGFLPELLGGYYPQLHLNNAGVYYDQFYTHKSDSDSVLWLSTNYNSKYYIQSDSYAGTKMLAIAGLSPATNILPVKIIPDSYVFLDYANVTFGKNVIDYKGDTFMYSYPSEFLKQYKNLIYNNVNSEIFK